MKENLKLVKKSCLYAISSICDPAVKVATQILMGKVMSKCHINELSVLFIVLTTQCTEGVHINWSNYLPKEFLVNYRKAQEISKMFHYVWLLQSILLVAW